MSPEHYGWDMKQTASIAATPFREAYQEQAYYDAVAQVEVDCIVESESYRAIEPLLHATD